MSKRSKFLIDAELLVLLVVGRAGPNYVSKHKRRRAYGVGDFQALMELLAPPARVFVTPNVLSEASNLLDHINEPARTEIFKVFRRLIEAWAEIYVPSSTAAALPVFTRLGLSDAACLVADIGDAALLTADNSLYLAALHNGRPAFNFRHLRAGSP